MTLKVKPDFILLMGVFFFLPAAGAKITQHLTYSPLPGQTLLEPV